MATIKYDLKALTDFITQNPGLSSKQIHEQTASGLSYATIKRLLQELIAKGFVFTTGKIKSTKYFISKSYILLWPIDVEDYFKRKMDERRINTLFNHGLIKDVLNKVDLFSEDELKKLKELQQRYRKKVKALKKSEYQKELELYAIDLSWKSSEIEGNTYSLLETERLIKDKQTAAGKTKDEAVMILNHKDAIDFIVSHRDYIHPLTLRSIEDIHSILIKELGIDRNIRQRLVRISGTNYKPLENDFQIKEAMEEVCGIINLKENVFEKALLILALISYIQPFNDGNKRTARIISNAILIHNDFCPMSFRTVDALDYKKAMLIFYEQNNISAVKKIFIEQFEFAVKTYF
jgi:Fic family protein